MNYGWLIGGGILGGVFTLGKMYEATRPVVEGEIVETNFTNEGPSRVRIMTEKEGYLELLLDTKPFDKNGTTIRIYAGKDYRGKADELQATLALGKRVKAKVVQKQGLERNVYELLNVYAPTEFKQNPLPY
ncbi:MAG: hypothetical protein AABX33_04170 [Nanoarchaeota archaeon]